MATKNVLHTVAGLTCTRKSPRVYTHATVVTSDAISTTRNATREFDSFMQYTARNNWKHMQDMANGTYRGYTQYADLYPPARIAEERAKAQAKLDSYNNNFGEYAADERARIEARHRSRVGRCVLAWHMSESAARRFANTQAGKGYYANVEVVEVTRDEPALPTVNPTSELARMQQRARDTEVIVKSARRVARKAR